MKYFFSRFVTVFIVVFFLHWIFNIKDQLIIFCGISNFFAQYLWWLFAILIAIIGYLLLNTFFLIMNRNELTGQYFYKDNMPDYNSWVSEIEMREGRNGIYGYKYYRESDYSFNFREKEMTLLENITHRKNGKLTVKEFFKTVTSWHFTEKIIFDIEMEKEKNVTFLLILMAISIWVIKGNPFINNFYGISKSFEFEGTIEEYDRIIVSKKYVKEAISIMESNCRDDEDCTVRKQGYIFEEAGVFNGFEVIEKNIPFLRCLSFALIERFIHTTLYFLLPYLLSTLLFFKSKDETI